MVYGKEGNVIEMSKRKYKYMQGTGSFQCSRLSYRKVQNVIVITFLTFHGRDSQCRDFLLCSLQQSTAVFARCIGPDESDPRFLPLACSGAHFDYTQAHTHTLNMVEKAS
jgi:hypothetical protein